LQSKFSDYISLLFSFSPSLANVENTPVKIIPIKKISFDFDESSTVSSTQDIIEENEVVEETPIKEEDNGNDMLLPSDLMAREIQRLSVRLRSSTPCKISIN
jgi:hypothetical protein